MEYNFEKELIAEGFSPICGIDEAGRGPLAGPVCAGAVILPDNAELPGLNDSKKLTPKRRDVLFDLIKEQAVAYGVGWADENEIDRVNILQATFLAMRRAVMELAVQPSAALVDGNRDPGLFIPARCVVGGDGLSPSIAAASILAKVSRDRYMEELDGKYPNYGFIRHKGYPTEQHYRMILKYGVSPVHRKSFLKNLEQKAAVYAKK